MKMEPIIDCRPRPEFGAWESLAAAKRAAGTAAIAALVVWGHGGIAVAANAARIGGREDRPVVARAGRIAGSRAPAAAAPRGDAEPSRSAPVAADGSTAGSDAKLSAMQPEDPRLSAEEAGVLRMQILAYIGGQWGLLNLIDNSRARPLNDMPLRGGHHGPYSDTAPDADAIIRRREEEDEEEGEAPPPRAMRSPRRLTARSPAAYDAHRRDRSRSARAIHGRDRMCREAGPAPGDRGPSILAGDSPSGASR
ncbi:MAG: hypothetical protein R3F11_13475 [Verrucomicrobiales bacterium]